MTDFQISYAAAIGLLLGALVVCKRAVFGPQKKFARTICATVVMGFLLLMGSSEQGDPLSLLAALTLFAGLLLALLMQFLELKFIYQALARKRP
jgi:hypothetical protein